MVSRKSIEIATLVCPEMWVKMRLHARGSDHLSSAPLEITNYFTALNCRDIAIRTKVDAL